MAWAPQAMAANRTLRRAQRAYEQLDYDKVTPLLKKALETTNLPEEEVEIYTLLATMHVMYGRDTQAEEAFVHILERQPDFELAADASPKLLAAFEAAELHFAEHASDERPVDEPDELGDATNPIDSPMDPLPPSTPPAPFYSTWWFWTAVGVVVAGAAGTTTYLLARPRFPDTAFGPYDL